MGSRPRRAALLAAVAASAALSKFPARAGEQPMPEKSEEPRPGASSFGLPSVPGLGYQFHLDATWGSFGFHNSLYTNPKPDQPSGNLGDHWFEGTLKAGLSASYSGWAGQIYGKVTAAGERTYGAPFWPGGYDWGVWAQGEIAGEYFVSNSNLISHQVRLHLAPSEGIGMGLIFYHFLLDQPPSLASGVTSKSLASELDWYTDWNLNAHFSFSLILAWATPGEAVVQAYGRTQDFWYGMIYAAYHY
jgi:hypothetical protein